MKKIAFITFFSFALNLVANAQNWGQFISNGIANGLNQVAQMAKHDRSMIRNTIQNNNGCTSAALTINQGAVVIVGGNGYQYSSGVPQGFQADVNQIRNLRKFIKDICITENGKWSIITTDNYMYGNTPQSVRDAYVKSNSAQSLSFNDGGEYVIVQSDGSILTNVQSFKDFYEEHKNDYGTLISVNLYSGGSVWCYSNYTTYCGNIPSPVASAINNLSFRPSYVKFNSHGDYVAYSAYNYYYDIANTDARTSASLSSNWPSTKQNANSDYVAGGDVYVPSYNSSGTTNSSGSSSSYQRTPKQCTLCHGGGQCYHCHGTGKDHATFGGATYMCATCHGKGTCPRCGGSGVR